MNDNSADPCSSNRAYVKKNKFSPEEDSMLLRIVGEVGANDWIAIASRMPGRNQRQCRERWTNYVNPELKPMPWTAEEDKILETQYERLGPRWRLIASFFKNRSINNVKNRWLTKKRREQKRLNNIQIQAPLSVLTDEVGKIVEDAQSKEANAPKPKKVLFSIRSNVEAAFEALIEECTFAERWF